MANTLIYTNMIDIFWFNHYNCQIKVTPFFFSKYTYDISRKGYTIFIHLFLLSTHRAGYLTSYHHKSVTISYIVKYGKLREWITSKGPSWFWYLTIYSKFELIKIAWINFIYFINSDKLINIYQNYIWEMLILGSVESSSHHHAESSNSATISAPRSSGRLFFFFLLWS